jgi:hypothetical protein
VIDKVSRWQGKGTPCVSSTRCAICLRVINSALAASMAVAIMASDSARGRPPLWPPRSPHIPDSRQAWSGSRYALLHSGPLRTVHASFRCTRLKPLRRHLSVPGFTTVFLAYYGFLWQLRWCSWRLLAESDPPSVLFTMWRASQWVPFAMGS